MAEGLREVAQLLAGQRVDFLRQQAQVVGRFGVRDELKRSWKRETRLDRQKQGFDTPTPQTGGQYAVAG